MLPVKLFYMWNLLNSVERTKPSWNSAETLWYMFFLTQYMSNDVATSVQRLNMRHRLQTEEKFKLQSFTDIIPIYEIWYTYNIINQNIDYKSGGSLLIKLSSMTTKTHTHNNDYGSTKKMCGLRRINTEMLL